MVDSTQSAKAAPILQLDPSGVTLGNSKPKGNFDNLPVSELPPVPLLYAGNQGHGPQSAPVGPVGGGGTSAPPEYVPGVGAPDRKPDPAPKGAEVLGRMDLDEIFRTNTLLRERVESVAKELDLDPGLLAATLFAEVNNERTWSRTSGSVESEKLGLDDWFDPAVMNWIKRVVREHPGLDFDIKDVKKTGEMWDVSTEKEGAGLKPRGTLNAENAVKAVGVYLKAQEEMLSVIIASDASLRRLKVSKDDIQTMSTRKLEDLTPEQRLTVLRAAFNAGVGFGSKLFVRLANGDDIQRTGKTTRDPDNAERTAVLHMARAVHLSQEIFGRPASDYTPPQAGLGNSGAAIMFSASELTNLPDYIVPIKY